MSGRDSKAASIWVAVVGWTSVWSLMVTAASGLWLAFAYTPDAASAWDNIEELQTEIRRGLFVADVRHVWSAIAVGSTMVWLALMLAVRRPAALVVGLALGLSLVARLTAGEPALTERTLFEAGAAVVGVVAALYWHLAPRASASAAGTTLARWFRA